MRRAGGSCHVRSIVCTTREAMFSVKTCRAAAQLSFQTTRWRLSLRRTMKRHCLSHLNKTLLSCELFIIIYLRTFMQRHANEKVRYAQILVHY